MCPNMIYKEHKESRCHGADGRDAKGQLGLEGAVDSCHNSEPQLGALPRRAAQPEALTRCNPTAWPPGPWNQTVSLCGDQ